jgi:type I restriction enzyme, S subunit
MSDRNGALPDGWEQTSLGELKSFSLYGPRFSSDDYASKGIPVLRTSDIDDAGHVNLETPPRLPLTPDVFKNYRLEQGDLLITRTGSLGTLAVFNDEIDAIAGAYLIQYRLSAPSDTVWYLYHLMKSPSGQSYLLEKGAGTGRPNLNVPKLDALSIPLPPLPEQRRIVSKIESLQSRSSRARRALSEVGPLLEQFRQSVLSAAFSGRLTADWRAANPDVEPASELLSRIRTERRQRWEQAELAKYEAKGKKPPKAWKDRYKEPEPVDESALPELPTGWCWTALETLIVDGPTNGYSPKTTQEATGTPALKLSATTRRRLIINDDTIKNLDDVVPSDSKYWLVPDDILIQRSNSLDYVGAAAFYDGPASTYVYPDIMIRVRASQNVCRRLLPHLFNSPQGSQFFRNNATGTAGNMPKINGTTIRRTPIPLAPRSEQEAMQSIIAETLEAVLHEETVLSESRSALTQLDQSILAKAFRGELVPQDPRDEPASELLARIRARRIANDPGKAAKKAIGRRKSTKAHHP